MWLQYKRIWRQNKFIGIITETVSNPSRRIKSKFNWKRRRKIINYKIKIRGIIIIYKKK